MIDSAHVARATWRWFLGMECEGIDVDERIWDVGVELIRLDHAQPRSWFVLESWLVVEVEAGFNDWVASVDAGVVEPVVAFFVGVAPDCEYEFNDWVVKVELDMCLAICVVCGVLLELYDECFEWHGSEFLAFCDIEVDVCSFECSSEIGIGEAGSGGAVAHLHVGSGSDDAVFETFELDLHLNAVELERRERERISTVLGEPEWKRDV